MIYQEILYNEVEQFYGDENENASEEKRPVEMVTLSNDLEPWEVNQAGGTVTDDDDDDLDFLDDGRRE
ncbi:hypothetical protein CDL15_Pgr023261 [Punica granatum]|uniref:Uncharacterized protein n=1 Tax=Punica granatum TaxID=22663 RepID=A0A218X540_PUNGR|nr:hypothetical protein CDL15_Pgr023261 [Punica granatum]